MKIKCHQVLDIPKMAWSLEASKDLSALVLKHGSWVETNDRFFFEGVWEGSFEEGFIHESSTLMGSGGVLIGENLYICCPSHTSEGLFSIIKPDGRLFFSNSIPFILTMSNEDLDLDYLDYENDIMSISDGLSKYKRYIPTKNGGKINIHYFCNLLVNKDGELKEVQKESIDTFSTFDGYYDFLLSTLKKINDNATNHLRNKKYSPIVFSSNGYDSTACAALGREINCNEAVVYESKRTYKEDSGRKVVEKLGYKNVIEKQELDYKKYNLDHEFVSSGELGSSIFFAAAEEELEGKYLLSGIHGDKIWSKDITSNDDLKRSFFPDTAKKEFRLRVGFVNVIIPFFGVTKHHIINSISNSEEMAPFTLGTDYDRPIPRRIVEQKNVPRNLFGAQKDGGAGSSLRFANLKYLEGVMSPNSFKEFKEFYLKNKVKRNQKFKRDILYFFYCLDIFLASRNINILSKTLNINNWNRKHKCSPWAPSYLFPWGVSKLKSIYKNAQ